MIDTNELRRVFGALYGNETNAINATRTPRLFCAPGRVNLIGEHTDYNEGLPPALPPPRVLIRVCASFRSTVMNGMNLICGNRMPESVASGSIMLKASRRGC
ncbi:MAG: hypothetical protein NVSMB56_04050 [Pyrinomonadaceae bacterium]